MTNRDSTSTGSPGWASIKIEGFRSPLPEV